MKKQTRNCTFETNSSSTHSLIIMPKNLYNKWTTSGDAYLLRKKDFDFKEPIDLPEISIFSKADVLIFLKNYLPDLYNEIDKRIDETLEAFGILNYDNFSSEYDIIEENYKTDSDEIVCVSYYGCE